MVTVSLCRVASRRVLANVYLKFYLGQLDGYANISKRNSRGFYTLIISSAHILIRGHISISMTEFLILLLLCVWSNTDVMPAVISVKVNNKKKIILSLEKILTRLSC